MTLEIKTSNIEPIRNTYGHIARRFGDKPASRYQEATYDNAALVNFHYKPLWDPDHDLNDPRRTAIQMEDWYALKDPRQFYYGTYVQNRAQMQEKAEGNFSFFEKRDLGARLSEDVVKKCVRFLLPLRHVEQTANLNNMHCSASTNYCTALAQATKFEAMDRLGNAQYFSRVGLALDGNSGATLNEAKEYWMTDSAWQGVRAFCEKTLTVKDWYETFLAQNLVFDALLNDLYYRQMDEWLTANGGQDVLILLDFMSSRLTDSQRWVDSVVKLTAAESEANKELVQSWISAWRISAQQALEPLASAMLGEEALADAFSALETRLGKIGLGG